MIQEADALKQPPGGEKERDDDGEDRGNGSSHSPAPDRWRDIARRRRRGRIGHTRIVRPSEHAVRAWPFQTSLRQPWW
jgi:hypothetical protein